MSLQNRDGTDVDPVPFLVTALGLTLIVLSWGPGYLLAFGLSLPTALGICVATVVPLTAAAYYRLVWNRRPEHAQHIPPSERIKHLAYAILAGALILVLLALPLYARYR